MLQKSWAICAIDHGVDGRAPENVVIKKLYDDESEAREHVFAPYEVRQVEIDLLSELEKLKARMTPTLQLIFSHYKSEAIIQHLTGKASLFQKVK